MYYIQDSRNYVGNSVIWWQIGGGYTSDITKAKKYTEEEAKYISTNRNTDIAWPVEYVDANIKQHVDMQYLNKENIKIW